MKPVARLLAGLAAVAVILLLAGSVAAPQSAARQVPLVLLAALALVGFARPGARWLLAAVVPAGPVLDFWFLTPDRGVYATEVVLLAALATWLAGNATGRNTTPWTRPSLPALLLAAFGLVGALALVAGQPDELHRFVAWRALRVLLLAAGAVFLLSAVAIHARRPVAPVWTAATLATLLVLALGGIVEFLRDGAGQFEAGSFYASSVGLAVHVAFTAPLALCIWLGPSGRRWRLLAAAAWLTALVCLPLTASRGALAAVAITSVLAVVVHARRARRTAWRGAAAVMLALALVATVLAVRPELAGEAFAYKYRASVEGDFFSTRTVQWHEAWRAIAARPLVGEGPGAWAPSVPLELARRHGVPAALLALAAIILAAWSAGKRAWQQDGGGVPAAAGLHAASLDWGLALSLLGLLLVGLAETGLGARSTPLLVWLLVLAGLAPARA
ncbi:MAG: O-antigen ligase family protein [Candidatus Krumholzibacteriia bacterium]